MDKVKEELKNLDAQALRTQIEELRRARFVVQLNAKTGHIKDYSQFGKLRRSLARALTFARQKQG